MRLQRLLDAVALAAVAVLVMSFVRERREAAIARWNERDIVDVTSEHSFPASDPPSWTNTTAG